MKFSDINENLTEAPEKFDAKQGLMKQAKTKIKKKLSPTKKGREQAQVEDDTKQTAKQIKSQYNKWMAQTGSAGAKPSTESFIEFANEHAQELAPYVEQTAIKLKFHDKPKPQDIQKQVPTDGINYSVELDDKGAAKKDAKSAKPSPEEQAQIDKAYGPGGTVAKDAEAEAKELGSEEADESVEEDADDAEPKVDTSASIYEARLNAFLLLEKEISDNQLDTMIVRVIQAAAKGGAKPAQQAAQPSAQQAAQPATQQQAAASEENPKDGMRQRFSKFMTGTGNVSDIGKGGSGGGEGAAPNIDPDDLKALTGLLATIAKGKAGPKEQKVANQLLKSIKNTYG